MALKHKNHDIERVSAVQRTPQRSVHTGNENQNAFTPAVALQRVTGLPASALTPADVLLLQRTVGNRTAQRTLAGKTRPQPRRLTVQAKLVVGPANDHYEREADRVAAIVMQTPATSPPQVQRQHSEEEDHEQAIQTKPLVSSITPLIQRQQTTEEEDEKITPVQRRSDGAQTTADPGVEHGIERARGNGLPLPGNLRARMEGSFGADFSGVRVHADTAADSLNRAVHARAFTTGHDLFFRAGEYRPESRGGQELIAHELTHVLQQNAGRTRTHGLLLQREGNSDQGLVSQIQSDRVFWKMLSGKAKIAVLIGVPIIAPLAQMWESGKEAATEIYATLGKDPGFLTKLAGVIPITLGALVFGIKGLLEGGLRGLALGIGNPLYSVGKSVGKFLARGIVGIVAAPGVVWDFIKGLSVKAIKQAFREARGYFDADVTHHKYGNLSSEEHWRNFFDFGEPSARRKNYNRDELSDLANYSLQLSGGSTSAAKFLTGPSVASRVPGIEASASALSYLGAAGGVLGAVTSLWDASRGFKQWRDTSATGQQQTLGLYRGLSGVTSATQQTATATSNIGQLVNPAVSATAQVVSGSAAVLTGTLDIVRGSLAFHRATQNIARLEALKNASRDEDIRQAAEQARSTQRIRRDIGGSTLAKGLLGATGGGLLVAVAGGLLAASLATPFGWGLLAASAIVGAVATFIKWIAKRRRKKEVAMRELGVTESQMAKWEWEKKKIESAHWWPWNKERVAGLKALGPDPLQRKLDEYGFKSAGHFYANYINYTANKVYGAGVSGRENLETQINAKLDLNTAMIVAAKQAAISEISDPDLLEARLNLLKLEIVMLNSSRDAFDRSALMDYEQLKQNFSVEAAEGNLYPEVEKLLSGMGLRFDFSKEPAEPKPEKIGKALHE